MHCKLLVYSERPARSDRIRLGLDWIGFEREANGSQSREVRNHYTSRLADAVVESQTEAEAVDPCALRCAY